MDEPLLSKPPETPAEWKWLHDHLVTIEMLLLALLEKECSSQDAQRLRDVVKVRVPRPRPR